MKIRIKPIATDAADAQETPRIIPPPAGSEQRHPKLKIKRSNNNSSKIVLRKSFVAGYGYDSEASDREDDPTIENHMILRFKPGSEAEYVRNKINQKEPLDGITIKFKDPRNAVVTVQGKIFAAKLVDLPTITEVHKSFDKKNIFKVTDICQMLLVGDRISHEDTVLALPSNPKDYIFPHGLTPPLKNVRTRRFRKRASAKTIESVEKEVERLLNLDAQSERTTYTIMDRDEFEKDSSQPRMSMDPEDRDTGRDIDMDASDDEDFAANLEAQLNSPFESSATATPRNASVSLQPDQTIIQDGPGNDSEASSEGSEVGSDDDEDEDRDKAAKKSGQKVLKEGVAQLQAVIAAKKADIERAINPIMNKG
ncbi:hypothetical protein MRB53_039338 [Persea americana]|nr:hypothetical protein MRB53_039338 [Persea americana]